MAIEVRLLRNGDAPVLTKVAADVFDDPIDPRATAAFLADPRHHLAVAIDDALVVGFASAVEYIHPDKARPELWINEVGVAPTHQRRGIGRQLLGALMDVGRRAGCVEAWVLTEQSNTAATSLYTAAGGQKAPEGTIMFSLVLDSRNRPTAEMPADADRAEDRDESGAR